MHALPPELHGLRARDIFTVFYASTYFQCSQQLSYLYPILPNST